MPSTNCTHIRIRDTNDYDLDVENFIKSLETEYKIDFRCLPNWEYLVQRLHVAIIDGKRKIQGAHLRKNMIIEKLYMQSTRPSPFELTSRLCRTASKWRKIEMNRKNRRIPVAVELASESESFTMLVEQSQTLHPNTIVSTESLTSQLELTKPDPSIVEVSVGTATGQEILPNSHLPVAIFTNPHKLISPLGSQSSCGMSFKSLLYENEATLECVKEEWQYLTPTSSVVCIPTPIILANNTLEQQFVQFTVINCASEYMHIRFKSVMDNSIFLTTKILPAIPKRLFPGMPVVFKLFFTLKNQEEFKSGLYFKVGGDVYDDAPPEALCIPMYSEFVKMHSVMVSDTITMPPVYPWHIKRNGKYSTATVNISVNDPYTYHLHIYKRLIDLTKELEISLSVKATGPNTESEEEREVDINEDTKPILSLEKNENSSESINIVDSIDFIVKSVIELALDTFLFESTYVYLKPYEKVKIPVYFTKNEHIGYHNSYYEFELLEPETEKLIMTKTLKVFAEVLPHPIKIHPNILDMSESQVSHGYLEDHFEITNSHKLAATIQIKLTPKMKKMFTVEPMESTVLPLSSVHFVVRFCSRDLSSVRPNEDLVHFTFKIIVRGHKSVFENVPPFFYEVIAPCAVQFKKVYNEKYFKKEPSLVMDLDQL